MLLCDGLEGRFADGDSGDAGCGGWERSKVVLGREEAVQGELAVAGELVSLIIAGGACFS